MRGDSKAQAGETQALANSNTLTGRGSQIFGTLAPQLEGDIAHPAGYNPTQLANMNTAAQQSAGGSQAGAVGQGGLLASRTNNAGGSTGAIAESSRRASQGLSGAALAISGKQADLQQQQRQRALAEEAGLYGENTGGATADLNAEANLSGANTNAANASWNWARYLADPLLQAGGSAAGGYLAGK